MNSSDYEEYMNESEILTTTTLPPPTIENYTYCSKGWISFWDYYDEYLHHELVLTICVAGIITNILNFSVLTQKVMYKNSFNIFLIVLTGADLLCVIRALLRHSLVFHRRAYGEYRTSYVKKICTLCEEIFFHLFHVWSIYITMTIAISRYFAVCHPLKSRNWFSEKNVKRIALATVVLSSLIIPPMYIGLSLQEGKILAGEDTKNGTKWFPPTQTPLGKQIKFWIRGILIKIFPCFVMTWITAALICSLAKSTRNRRSLMGNTVHRKKFDDPPRSLPRNSNFPPLPTVSANGVQVKRQNGGVDSELRWQTEFDRTTKMLIAILLLFVLAELPTGIFSLINAFMVSQDFYIQCFYPFLGFSNVCEYWCSSVNFFVYLAMSKIFRLTFLRMLKRGWERVFGASKRCPKNPFSGLSTRMRDMSWSGGSRSRTISTSIDSGGDRMAEVSGSKEVESRRSSVDQK